MSGSTPAKTPQPVGTVWEIKAKADTVEVTRPDRVTRRVAVRRGVAGYVLTAAGRYRAEVDGKTITVEVV